jgi:hypothetical protein
MCDTPAIAATIQSMINATRQKLDWGMSRPNILPSLPLPVMGAQRPAQRLTTLLYAEDAHRDEDAHVFYLSIFALVEHRRGTLAWSCRSYSRQKPLN